MNRDDLAVVERRRGGRERRRPRQRKVVELGGPGARGALAGELGGAARSAIAGGVRLALADDVAQAMERLKVLPSATVVSGGQSLAINEEPSGALMFACMMRFWLLGGASAICA